MSYYNNGGINQNFYFENSVADLQEPESFDHEESPSPNQRQQKMNSIFKKLQKLQQQFDAELSKCQQELEECKSRPSNDEEFARTLQRQSEREDQEQCVEAYALAEEYALIDAQTQEEEDREIAALLQDNLNFNPPHSHRSRVENSNPSSASRRNRDLEWMDAGPRENLSESMIRDELVGEDTDYETLMNLFPPEPTGANLTAIERLPIETFQMNSNNRQEERQRQRESQRPRDIQSQRQRESQRQSQRQAQPSTQPSTQTDGHRCSICLEAFKEGEQVRRLPCLHIFHTDEIDRWLAINQACPICRTSIEQT